MTAKHSAASDFFDQLRANTATFDDAAVQQFDQCVKGVKQGDIPARLKLATGLLVAGFSNPSIIPSLYDQLAQAWLAQSHPQVDPPHSHPAQPGAGCVLDDAFWHALRALHSDGASLDPGSFTERVVGVGTTVATEFGELAEQLARSHPGAMQAQTRTAPPLYSLSELSQQPPNSLAAELHSMLTSNGFAPEVLDRQTIGLAQLSPALRYLNTRILQTHDLWHLVAGYQTTGLHEIGISAFQLAQFGHNYSAMFLASIVAMSCATQPEGLPILLQIISEGWSHGRQTVAFMGIHWEAEWHLTIDQIRQAHGIDPFVSQLPATLLESLAQNAQG